jgi:hypothetical protein
MLNKIYESINPEKRYYPENIQIWILYNTSFENGIQMPVIISESCCRLFVKNVSSMLTIRSIADSTVVDIRTIFAFAAIHIELSWPDAYAVAIFPPIV